MKLLLDTHAFLWFVAGDGRLSSKARRIIEENTDIHLSAASIWEMAIKSSLGRLILPEPMEDYLSGILRAGIRILPVEGIHAARVEKLPFHHRDPFDRLLVAQALVEDLTLVSGDSDFRPYGIKLAW